MLPSGQGKLPGMKTYVFSRTLQPRDHPNVTVVTDRPEETVAHLRKQSGKDIWLFGGGSLFRSLAEAKLVDTVEVAVIPILLGEGVPLLPPPAHRIPLALQKQQVYPSGIVSLEYAIR
jgi:dihydrofolate reductase